MLLGLSFLIFCVLITATESRVMISLHDIEKRINPKDVCTTFNAAIHRWAHHPLLGRGHDEIHFEKEIDIYLPDLEID